jgi:ATP-dependent Clp protease, protease subunit
MYFDKDSREIFIYSDIGQGFDWMSGEKLLDAESITYALKEMGSGDISVRVNSYGGSVDQALAMIEILGRHSGNISVTVDSIAASAASLFPVVFPSTAAKHARVMIHDPWGFAMGNAREMRKTADILDSYRDSLLSVYKQGMKSKSDDEIVQLMAEETWFSAESAFEAGLVGGVTEPAKKVDPKPAPSNRFKNIPQDLMKQDQKPVQQHFPLRVAAALAIAKRKLRS